MYTNYDNTIFLFNWGKLYKKFNLAEYIEIFLIPQNSITQQSSFDDIFAGINSGYCALFVDTLSVCFDIDVKGLKIDNSLGYNISFKTSIPSLLGKLINKSSYDIDINITGVKENGKIKYQRG